MLERFMVVGHSNSYKDLIVCALEEASFSGSHKSCPCVIYGKHTINTPDEYLENPKLYSALVSLSQQSTTIIFVKNANDEHHHFPPGFSSAFPCKSLGVALYSTDNISSAIMNSIGEFKSMGICEENIYIVNYECFEELDELSKLLIRL